MESHKAIEFFGNLNLTILPEDVADYIKTQIMTDNNLSLVSEDDVDFVEVKNYIEANYPAAINKDGAPAAPAKSVAEQIQAIEALIGGWKLKMGRAMGADKTRLKDAIGGFELMLKRLKSKKQDGGTIVDITLKSSDPHKDVDAAEACAVVSEFTLVNNDPSKYNEGGNIGDNDPEEIDSPEFAREHHLWEISSATDNLPLIGDMVDTRGWILYNRTKNLENAKKQADRFNREDSYIAMVTEAEGMYYIRTREKNSQDDEKRVYEQGGKFEKLAHQ